MSYRGRPSRGCQVCRTRKVKCDEVKPVCGRCARSGVECVYRDAFELVHRNQTQSAEQNAREKWRGRARHSNSGSPAPSPLRTPQSVPAKSTTPSPNTSDSEGSAKGKKRRDSRHILHSPTAETVDVKHDLIYRYVHARPGTALRPSLHELAFLRLYFDFIHPPEVMYKMKGAFEPIPVLYTSLPSSSTLVMAVNAVAYINYAGRVHSSETAEMGHLYYGKALRSLAVATSNPATAAKTETLISAFLLSLYEMLHQTKLDGSYVAHLIGGESILKLRATADSSIRLGAGFQQSGLGMMLIGHAMMRHLGYFSRPPPWMERLISEFSEKENTRANMLRRFHRAVCLCADMKETEKAVLDGQTNLPHNPAELFFHAQLLDDQYAAWENGLPGDVTDEWCELHASMRKSRWIRDLYDRPGAPTSMFRAKGVVEWSFHRIPRLNLNLSMTDLYDALLEAGWTPSPSLKSQFGANIPSGALPGPGEIGFEETDAHVSTNLILRLCREILSMSPHFLGIQPPSHMTLRSSQSHSPPRETITRAPVQPRDPTSGWPKAPSPERPLRRIQDPPAPANDSIQPKSDPANTQEISGMRGYHMWWPMFNVLRVLKRQRMSAAETTGMEGFAKHLMRFLWNELSIAKAEAHVNWFEQGLPDLM